MAASTQSQASNAIVFLYDYVLGQPIGPINDLKRVQRRTRLPVALTQEEIKAAPGLMDGTSQLIAELINGAGLRVRFCLPRGLVAIGQRPLCLV